MQNPKYSEGVLHSLDDTHYARYNKLNTDVINEIKIMIKQGKTLYSSDTYKKYKKNNTLRLQMINYYNDAKVYHLKLVAMNAQKNGARYVNDHALVEEIKDTDKVVYNSTRI